MANYVADRRLYLTEDGNTVVEEGDPRAAFLLASEGSEVPAAEAKRLGLSPKSDGPAERPGPDDDAGNQPGGAAAGADTPEPQPVRAKVVRGPKD